MMCGVAVDPGLDPGRLPAGRGPLGFSVVLDITDGAVARLVGAVTPFGLQFDSLADLVSFGLAPALLTFTMFSAGRAHSSIHSSWMVCFLWVACAAIRLARFNTTIDPTADKRYFIGMPSPGPPAWCSRRCGPSATRCRAGPALGAAARRRPGAADGHHHQVPLVPVPGQPEEPAPLRPGRLGIVLVVGFVAVPRSPVSRSPTATCSPRCCCRRLARWPGCCPPASRSSCRDRAPGPARRRAGRGRPGARAGRLREGPRRGPAHRGTAHRRPVRRLPRPVRARGGRRRRRRGRHGAVVPELLHLARHARRSTSRTSTCAPAHRGTGLGRELLRTLAALCVERGYSRLEWSVLDWNTPSIDFYKAAGRRPDGRLDRVPPDRRRPVHLRARPEDRDDHRTRPGRVLAHRHGRRPRARGQRAARGRRSSSPG